MLVFACIYTYQQASDAEVQQDIVIATGTSKGSYYAMGLVIQNLLETSGQFGEVEVIKTQGSVENLELLEAPGGADFALVQGDVAGQGDVRLVADLYKQILHIMVARRLADQVQSIHDLAGLRLSMGPIGSGTRVLVTDILEHFKIEPGESLTLEPGQAVDALIDDEIDAAFILTAMSMEMINELADADAVRFISIGNGEHDRDGSRANASSLETSDNAAICDLTGTSMGNISGIGNTTSSGSAGMFASACCSPDSSGITVSSSPPRTITSTTTSNPTNTAIKPLAAFATPITIHHSLYCSVFFILLYAHQKTNSNVLQTKSKR